MGAVVIPFLEIPGVLRLTPRLLLEVGASVDVSGALATTFGTYLAWNRISTSVDLKNPARSKSNGWQLDKPKRVFTMPDALKVKGVSVFIIPSLEVSVELLDGSFKVAAGFFARSTFGAAAEPKVPNTDPNCRVKAAASVEVNIDVAAQMDATQVDPNRTQRLFTDKGGVDSPFCVSHTRGKRSIASLDAENYKEHNKRQVRATVSNVSFPFKTAPIVNVSDIFFPKNLGNFQLALQSDNSIVMNASSLLIQDASTNRYLHSYGDVQHNDYGRFRTHLASRMPYDSKLIFWSFAKGYLQLNRGSLWQYDTAGCLNTVTGTVQLWLIDGQQGLSAIQAKYGNCGLAPLVPINY